jgi:hypothetical protein
MIDLSSFSEDYASSRARFMEYVARCAGKITSYLNSAVQGPNGEVLYADVGVFGPPDATKSLLLISGVHGPEAIAGAAVLNDVVTSGLLGQLPKTMKAVLVHALNPWGMAHGSRTTENNVDLNRNFIDFSVPLPRNPLYGELHAQICSSDIETATKRLRDSIRGATASAKASAKIAAIMRGQYEYPDGVNFGGHREEWSNRIFREIIATHLSQAEQVACIDWHTGIGQAAQAVPLAFYPADSHEAAALSRWHKQDVTLFGRHFPGGEAPRFTGILNMALPEMLPFGQTYAVVVEFGTKPNADVLDALMVDRWLKHSADSRSPLAKRLRHEMIECFSPRDANWRAAVLGLSRSIVTRTIEGLATL